MKQLQINNSFNLIIYKYILKELVYCKALPTVIKKLLQDLRRHIYKINVYKIQLFDIWI